MVERVARDDGATEVLVRWLKEQRQEWVCPEQLRCGFRLGMVVQDVPRSRTRRSLGEGVVLEKRSLGDRDQVLVEFPERGERLWLPFQNLKRIKGVRERFELGQTGEPGNAERFRLRCLAHAIELWHENTGALSRLDIDPLPHQIHLVHHILASGNLNWLIADDVGLGKTIEVGMLLSALIRRGTFRRILLVTPAGLVKQWQDEFHHKFGMSDFQIYGEDFHITEPRHWKLYDHVIGSIDRLKADQHVESLMAAGAWDFVVFDEAHRLGRTQWGMKYQSTERFRLAATLRKATDAMVLLTATPHQGKQDKFQTLLELMRPELKEEIRTLSHNPEILRQMVIRNHKADVTDAEGNFIFQGKTTAAIGVPLGEEEKSFDESLRKYLREGYAAGERIGNKKGRAIGFVMTIYRKLAASSAAAIEAALVRRLARLREQRGEALEDPADRQATDERYVGEWEEGFDRSAKEFFVGEIPLLEALLEKARALLLVDRKLRSFVDGLVSTVLETDRDEKIVIFTEYLATQKYLAHTLQERFGERAVALIHGGQDHGERAAQIAAFEDVGQFLVSTEAGGEGINLHRKCHVMVNYDLPWNPMRLVQRVGRLYRYGQKKKVVVFNVHSPQTMDGQILDLLYRRIDQVVADLAVLGGEFQPGLEAEILGDFAGVLEVEAIMEAAARPGIEHTEDQIEQALSKAREAAVKQRDLLEYAAGYDPEEARGELKITRDHLQSFLEGVFDQFEIQIVERSHKEKVLRIRLSEQFVEELGLRGQYHRVTVDRDLAATRPDVQMMDMDNPLFRYFLERAKAYRFDGRVAALANLGGAALVTAMLRWQNDQGVRLRQEFGAFLVQHDGRVESNPDKFSEWLLAVARDGTPGGNRDEARPLLESAETALGRRLGDVSNQDLHPEGRQLVSAGWCDPGKG